MTQFRKYYRMKRIFFLTLFNVSKRNIFYCETYRFHSSFSFILKSRKKRLCSKRHIKSKGLNSNETEPSSRIHQLNVKCFFARMMSPKLYITTVQVVLILAQVKTQMTLLSSIQNNCSTSMKISLIICLRFFFI